MRYHLQIYFPIQLVLRFNKSRSQFFEKINRIKKSLSRLIKKKRERTQINKIRNERGETVNDTTEIQRIVRDYYGQLYTRKFKNQGEMDKFLETYNFLKLSEEEAKSLKRPITATEIKEIIKKYLAHKALDIMVSQENFTKHLRNS